MSEYLREPDGLFAYFYAPEIPPRVRLMPVHGWQLAGPPRSSADRAKPHGLPVLLHPDGALRLHDPSAPLFLGIAVDGSPMASSLRRGAHERFEREQAGRVAAAAERAREEAEEASRREAEARRAQEAARAAEEAHRASLDAVPEVLAGARALLAEATNK